MVFEGRRYEADAKRRVGGCLLEIIGACMRSGWSQGVKSSCRQVAKPGEEGQVRRGLCMYVS